jgi:heme exporter protein A
MDESVIRIDSVSKSFEHRRVLKEVSLDVHGGESVFVCGINGVGKSTLLRIISGLLEPDAGSVRICGHDMANDPEKAKPMLGVISHKSMVYSELTVLENLRFFAGLYGVSEARRRVDEIVEEMGLGPYRYDRAAVLSRGLLQRLSIARSLIHSPTVLLADEPFTGLDSKACSHLVERIAGFIDASHAVVMTTHDANIGLRCCGRVVVLDGGAVVFDGPTEGIDGAEFVKDYVGYARSRG